MILKAGDIVKHFKGEDLIEKNIYKIISVNPKYTCLLYTSDAADD